MTDGARGGNNKGAELVGETIAERLKEKGITAWCSIATGSSTTAACATWPRPRAQPGWSFRRSGHMMMRTREKIDAAQLDIKDTVVSINRVTKVVKGGKNLSFSALVVVGDGHGVVGFGVGKAKEVPSAIKKGIEAAKKNLIRVPLKGTSIPHPVARPLRRRPRAAEARAGRHRHHRRRRRARGGRSGGRPQRADQVARHGQPAQRRARGVHGAVRMLKDPGKLMRLRGKDTLEDCRRPQRVRAAVHRLRRQA